MDNEQIFMRAAEILQASGIDPRAAFAEAEKTANDALDGAALELLTNLGYEIVETEEKTADDELTMQALEFLGNLGYQVQEEAEKTAEELVLEDMVENRAAQMLLESGIHPLTGEAIEKTAEAIDTAANEFLAYKAELAKEAAGKMEAAKALAGKAWEGAKQLPGKAWAGAKAAPGKYKDLMTAKEYRERKDALGKIRLGKPHAEDVKKLHRAGAKALGAMAGTAGVAGAAGYGGYRALKKD